MSAIIGYANLLLRQTQGQLSPLQTENLQDLLSNAKRQLNLIDSLLDFAKIEAGKTEILREPVMIDELIQARCPDRRPMLNKDSVRLHR